MKTIGKILLFSLCTAVLENNGVHAYCSCWDQTGVNTIVSPLVQLPKSRCGGGIAWDTALLSHNTCKGICERKWPGFPFAYIDQPAFKQCQEQNPSAIIVPTNEQKAAVKLALDCEIESLVPALWTFGIASLKEGLDCKDLEALKNKGL